MPQRRQRRTGVARQRAGQGRGSSRRGAGSCTAARGSAARRRTNRAAAPAVRSADSRAGITFSRPLRSTPPVTTRAIRTCGHCSTHGAVIVLQVNLDFDRRLTIPTSCSGHIDVDRVERSAPRRGAGRVVVVQRFHRRAIVTRNGVEHRLRRVCGRRCRRRGRDRYCARQRSRVSGARRSGCARRCRRARRSSSGPCQRPAAAQRRPACAPAVGFRRRGCVPLHRGAVGRPVAGRRYHPSAPAVYEVLEASTALRPMPRAARVPAASTARRRCSGSAG